MLYTELKIGEESYKLRLTTKNSIQLERALGYNPIGMLMEIEKGKMPRLNDILIILHSMLQTYHHGMSMDKVYDLFDAYAEKEGKSMFDLIPVFVEVFQQSGYITKEVSVEEVEDNSKN
jgi:hypothetical protein